MWISKVDIGAKKILCVLLIYVVLALLSLFLFPVFSNFIAGFALGTLAVLLYLIYKLGFFKRLYRFTDGSGREVLRYKNPSSPGEDYLYIGGYSSHGNQIVESAVFTANNRKWKFYDILRIILKGKKKSSLKKVLILGGGGGSLIYTILSDYPLARIDAVENSSQMLYVAQKYFLRDIHLKKTSFLYVDAIKFVNQKENVKSQYDFIIVDIFNNGLVPSQIYKAPFARSLRSLLKPDGVIFINFGFREVKTDLIKANYPRSFKNFKPYLYFKNVIGLNIPVRKDVPNIMPI